MNKTVENIMNKHDFTIDNRLKIIKPFELRFWSSNVATFVKVKILSMNSFERLNGCIEELR